MDSILKAVTSFKDKIVKTPLERLVWDACTDENWGVATTSLHQISERTYSPEERVIIMRNIWELLASPPKEWRRLYKVLNLIDHLLKFGSSSSVSEIQSNIFKIKMFQDFSFREGIEEKGVGIRDKAKYLNQLLNDGQFMDEEKDKARKMWSKMNGSQYYQEQSRWDDRRDDTRWGGGREERREENRWDDRRDETRWNGAREEKREEQREVSNSKKEPFGEWVQAEKKHNDIFQMPEPKNTSIWDAPGSGTAVKTIKPPTGFHPAGPKSALSHSQSMNFNKFDLLFDDKPVPQLSQHSVSTNSNPSKPSANVDLFDLQIKPSVASNDLLFDPINTQKINSSSSNLLFESSNTTQRTNILSNNLLFEPTSTQKPSAVSNIQFVPEAKPSFNMQSDLIFQPSSLNPQSSGLQYSNKDSLGNPSNLSGYSNVSLDFVYQPQSTFVQPKPQTLDSSQSRKLNVNLTGGTSMEQMKHSGFTGFNNFVSAPVRKEPESLESKLFNLDNLSLGQPKEEPVKSRW